MKDVIDYTVSGEPQKTEACELPAQIILKNAGYDPETHYLTLMQGNSPVSYRDKANDSIHMHEHMKFLAISCEPTPVS